MKSLTFVIPVRIDNSNRWENLLTSIKYLLHTFPKSEIFLVEDSPKSNCASLAQDCGIHYYFIQNSENFSRAQAINLALKMATSEYIMTYDLDILIPEDQIRACIKILDKGIRHIVLPHISVLLDVQDPLKAKLSENLNFKLIPRFRSLWFHRNRPCIDLVCSGCGVAVFRRDLLIKIGGFNHKMKSYGWEDTEVLKRAAKLGIYYYSLYWGNIIHLHHARGKDSQQNEFYNINKKEYLNVMSMKPYELITYVRNELAIDKKNRFTIDDYKVIRRHNFYHMNYFQFAINRLILKFLNLKFA